MHPKIHSQQTISSKKITGPIGDYEPDDAAAVFTVVVSQVVNGGWAIGIGKSDVYKPPPPKTGPNDWSADVEMVTGTFEKGGAMVFAWASIAQPDGGWEMYPWGRPVHFNP
jgi:hypothetical protein